MQEFVKYYTFLSFIFARYTQDIISLSKKQSESLGHNGLRTCSRCRHKLAKLHLNPSFSHPLHTFVGVWPAAKIFISSRTSTVQSLNVPVKVDDHFYHPNQVLYEKSKKRELFLNNNISSFYRQKFRSVKTRKLEGK